MRDQRVRNFMMLYTQKTLGIVNPVTPSGQATDTLLE